ncbi:MAG: ABC transporter permease [Candidatus Promineifilaceae bacterium]|nr:ABC transporter permease [Candidatus Promineifilaceae bacterium]
MSDRLYQPVRVLLTLTIALIIGGIIIELSGKDALNAYQVLFDSAFGSQVALANTLLAATPLIFTGLATVVAFRAGVFNVGVEGSLYVGGFAAAWIGFTFTSMPGWFLIPAMILAAAVVGGLWGVVPGYLKARLRIDEVVTTIMLNYVAILFTSYLVTGPFLLPGMSNAMSAEIAPQAQFTRIIPRSQWNAAFFLALLVFVGVTVLLNRSTLGYEIKALGSNPIFARWSGMHVGKIIIVVMFISGFIGGLAGAGQVMGVHYRFIANFSLGLGFSGIVVALLGRNTTVGTLLAALFFGALRNGGSTMEIFTRIPRDLIDILQALIIFFVAVELSLSWLRWRRERLDRSTEAVVET